ncbi:hypothetical protein DIPPA_25066 [Diplonema papillatum]|nr:hypothetical protein DIPPA_25066 [Diplonema papillatum]
MVLTLSDERTGMPLEYVQSPPCEAALEYPNGGVVDAVDWRRPAAARCLARTNLHFLCLQTYLLVRRKTTAGEKEKRES